MTSRKSLIAGMIVALFLVILIPIVRGCSTGSEPYKVQIRESTGETGPTRASAVSFDHYIGNDETKKFHEPWCSYLPDQPNQILFETREEAIAAGYDPCGHCKP